MNLKFLYFLSFLLCVSFNSFGMEQSSLTDMRDYLKSNQLKSSVEARLKEFNEKFQSIKSQLPKPTSTLLEERQEEFNNQIQQNLDNSALINLRDNICTCISSLDLFKKSEKNTSKNKKFTNSLKQVQNEVQQCYDDFQQYKQQCQNDFQHLNQELQQTINETQTVDSQIDTKQNSNNIQPNNLLSNYFYSHKKRFTYLAATALSASCGLYFYYKCPKNPARIQLVRLFGLAMSGFSTLLYSYLIIATKNK